VGADLGSSSCYDGKAFQAGSFFVWKKVSRDYEKWVARTVANCPPCGDSEGTGCGWAVATCRPERGAERHATTHLRAPPVKSWRALVPNRIRTGGLGARCRTRLM